MNIKSFSKALEVNEHTLRKWEADFNIKVKRNKNNQRDYSKDDLAFFSKIKDLRASNNSIEEIKEHLNIDISSISEIIPETTTNTQSGQSTAVSRIDLLEQTLISKFDNITNIALEYSKVTHQLGKFEERNANLEEKVKLLSMEIKAKDELISKLNRRWYDFLFRNVF